jgi:beta-lactamase superfamily II metal-dependent hydrolase
MTSLHFLNVGKGDCTLIQHDSGRWTMVDICGGNRKAQRIGDLLAAVAQPARRALTPPSLFNALAGNTAPQRNGLFDLLESLPPPPPQRSFSALANALAGTQPRGNFGMDEEWKNPLDYLDKLGVTSIFRFISTHPEMDHLDGLDALFNKMPVVNFWTTGVVRDDPEFGLGCRFKLEDWNRYLNARGGHIQGTTSLRKRFPDFNFKYASRDDDAGNGVGDQLHILSPDDRLVQLAEQDGDTNDASFVISLTTPAGRVIIPGDAHDRTWRHVLATNPQWVQNCALLLAPHHGRDSEREYEFLGHLNPKLTLMGCVQSEHSGCAAWSRRNLPTISNTQAGNIRVDFYPGQMSVWVENAAYARKRCGTEPLPDSSGMFTCGIFITGS